MKQRLSFFKQFSIQDSLRLFYTGSLFYMNVMFLALLHVPVLLMFSPDVNAIASETCKKKIRNHVSSLERDRNIPGQEKCILTMRYIKWKNLLQGKERKFDEYLEFLNDKNNADWPRLNSIRSNFEKLITLANIHRVPHYIINNPSYAETALIYLSYLERQPQSNDQSKQLLRYARKYWREINFSTIEQHRTFLKKYGKHLRYVDHTKRAKRLLYSRSHLWLKKMLSLLHKKDRYYYEAIMALRRGDSEANYYISKLPITIRNKDQLLTLERVRWRRRHDYFDSASQMLLNFVKNAKFIKPSLQKMLWREQVILAREAIDKDRRDIALRLISGNSWNDIAKSSEENFLKGWIYLNMYNDRDSHIKAFYHFDKAAAIAKSPAYKAKINYWAAFAAAVAGLESMSKQKLYEAAFDFTSFYGQLARKELGLKKSRVLWRLENISEARKKIIINRLINRNKFFKMTALISDVGDDQDMAYEFLRTQLYKIKTQEQLDELVLFCQRYIPIYTCWVITIVNFRLMKNYKQFFPTLPVPLVKPVIDRDIIFALIKQESGFWYKAKSPVGAMGLMQLMPATAKFMAKKLGIKFAKQKLIEDISYNIFLGQNYLKKMINDHDNNLVHSFASYNAGPHNVKKWKMRDGYHKYSKINWLNSIELIPFGETRTYVEKVHANINVYKDYINHIK